MEIHEERLRPTIVDVLCDMCGQSCKKHEEEFEYATLFAHWGYFSKKDGTTTNVDMCEDCFDAVMAVIGPSIEATKAARPNDQSSSD